MKNPFRRTKKAVAPSTAPREFVTSIIVEPSPPIIKKEELELQCPLLNATVTERDCSYCRDFNPEKKLCNIPTKVNEW